MSPACFGTYQAPFFPRSHDVATARLTALHDTAAEVLFPGASYTLRHIHSANREMTSPNSSSTADHTSADEKFAS